MTDGALSRSLKNLAERDGAWRASLLLDDLCIHSAPIPRLYDDFLKRQAFEPNHADPVHRHIATDALSPIRVLEIDSILNAPINVDGAFGSIVISYPAQGPRLDRAHRDDLISAIESQCLARRRTRQLTTSLTSAEHAQKTQSGYINSLSHDIRTPLANVQAIFELLRNEANPEMQHQLLTQGLDQCRSAIQLFDSVLEYGRMSAGKLAPRISSCDLSSLCERIATGFRASCERRGLTITVKADERSRHCSTDATFVERIITNLVSNAIKYSTSGRVVITVSGDEAAVTSTVSVTDSGRGMTAEQVAKLFKPFERLGETREHGAGLGLTICSELAKLLGGRIEVSSEPLQGSIFTLVIPQRPTTVSSPTNPPFAGVEILVADDDFDFTSLLVRHLEKLGAVVTQAHTAREAQALILYGSYHVVICDGSFPDGDLRSVIACTSCLPAPPRFIALSGSTLDLDVTDLCAAALQKPSLPSEIARTVAGVLRERSVATLNR